MSKAIGPTPPCRIIILGALSAIAKSSARVWAQRGAHLMLVARDGARLATLAADLQMRGASQVQTMTLDLATSDTETSFAAMVAALGAVDAVLLAYGTLGEQEPAEERLSDARKLILINFSSAAEWCLAAAEILEQQKHGVLLVIGSVAGDRGRASNYIYGAAKGGLGILVQGIAHRLASRGARAVLIKPGFVDTPMTAAFENKGMLWAKPAAIAKTIVAEADKATGRPIVYAPGFWRYVMLIIRAMPYRIFHRTKL